MSRHSTIMFACALVILSAPQIEAHQGYTGMSGAPGQMFCASTCHGSGGGSIVIEGFPELYEPEQSYEITVTRSSGSNISNFNASCLIGAGSDNAGYFEEGEYTEVYTNPGVTNGVHFANSNHSQGTFFWIAPPAGNGEVTFYLAGLQGSYSGPNTSLVLNSSESLAATYHRTPPQFWFDSIYPNPFNPATTVRFSLARRSEISLEVFSIIGESVGTIQTGILPAGTYQYNWSPGVIPGGVYFFRLKTEDQQIVRKVCYLK